MVTYLQHHEEDTKVGHLFFSAGHVGIHGINGGVIQLTSNFDEHTRHSNLKNHAEKLLTKYAQC